MASDLESVAKALRDIATLVRDSGIEKALIHGATIKSIYIPEIQDWTGKARVDTESQVRSYLTGNQSKAELYKRQNEQKKLAAAKKPWPKKATKKKAT